MKSKFSTYNQGILWICETSNEASSFNAPRNPTASTDMKKVQRLDFNEVSKRGQDLDFAESKDRSLTMKVKTRIHPSATEDRQVLIGKELYDIFKVDPDVIGGKDMYLFLEKVRTLT